MIDIESNRPTPFSSIIFCALVFAADIAAGFAGVEWKSLSKNEMVSDFGVGC
jgi:hypothetical protein